MQLLEGEEIRESSVFQFLNQVIVQLQFLQTGQISEGVPPQHRNSVLGQHQRFQTEKIHERFFFELDDRVVVEPKPDERRKVPESSPLDHGQVVVAEVEVLELGHVGEGAADLHDRVVRHVQRRQVSQSVESVSRKRRLQMGVSIE